jgi:Xaa-Pro aminopeptidase
MNELKAGFDRKRVITSTSWTPAVVKTVTEERIRRFQALMKSDRVDASMIKTVSSFTYFTDAQWLRPGLIIPSEGDPVAFIPKHEVNAFIESSCIEHVVPYGGVDELMRGISSTIRDSGYRKVGFDMSVERDAYELFFHMFKNLNPKTEIVDVHSLIMQLRMIKDATELENIRHAARATDKAMETAFNAIRVGATELDIAAEATYTMMKNGSEHPHAYVNTGPVPRLHAEPRCDMKVGTNDAVTITLAADYRNYYSNETRTYIPLGAPKEKLNALETLNGIRSSIKEKLKPEVVLSTIEEEIGKALSQHGYTNNYVKGFTHGVGLLVEEDPITTIIIPHRRQVLKENMVIAAIHAPLAIPAIGAIKTEDTFLITPNAPEQLTKFV